MYFCNQYFQSWICTSSYRSKKDENKSIKLLQKWTNLTPCMYCLFQVLSRHWTHKVVEERGQATPPRGTKRAWGWDTQGRGVGGFGQAEVFPGGLPTCVFVCISYTIFSPQQKRVVRGGEVRASGKKVLQNTERFYLQQMRKSLSLFLFFLVSCHSVFSLLFF